MAKKKRREIVSDDVPLTSNPFAGLAGALGPLPEGPPVEAEPAPPEPRPKPAAPASARVIVRRQKKGQGGKAATFVEGLAAEQRTTMLAALKRELGCSGRIEGEAVVLGTKDHARVARWFEAAGVGQVVLGN
ncbi:translation initiation factor [Pseudenhygromyxa sp. WMMC2535]|uniref:translation initiation factor n=1 Tax=Pseudenhygromyxa sp. WMMC2535 TaxID=2712867 RepID=UPI001557BFC2|nr:translation initiation factor [Pseudenhygromyxa sp. WMMC2535]NVB37345.1 translation initiation factor [Pseudenhygromyxa sp. WMMC2535]